MKSQIAVLVCLVIFVALGSLLEISDIKLQKPASLHTNISKQLSARAGDLPCVFQTGCSKNGLCFSSKTIDILLIDSIIVVILSKTADASFSSVVPFSEFYHLLDKIKVIGNVHQNRDLLMELYND